MQFLKTLFWVALAVILVLFARANWSAVTLKLWGGLEADVKLPVLVLASFLIGFLLIRPQQKRMKAHQAMLSAVKRNDTVVTSGGMIGKVTKVEDAEIEVELAQGVRVRVVKTMLAEVRETGGKPAND